MKLDTALDEPKELTDVTVHYPDQIDLFPQSHIQVRPSQAMNPIGYRGLHAFHKYWGKKPSEPMMFLVENLCPRDGIVLDPFLGSGLLTRITRAANRRFIGIDINPVSIELGKLFHDLPRPDVYEKAINIILDKVKSIIYNSYKRDDGSVATHFLWNRSKLLAVWTAKGRIRLEHEATDSDLELSRSFSGYEPKYLREMTTFSNSRINATPDLGLLDIFKHRACANIDILVNHILEFRDPIIRRALLLTLTAASGQMSNFVFAIDRRGKRNGRKISSSARTEVGSWAIGLWRPARHFEVNVWNCFFNRARKLQQALNSSKFSIEGKWTDNIRQFFIEDIKCALINQSAQIALQDIPNESVDLILTDPPHGDRMPYLELSDFWNSILQFSCSDFENEIVVSDARERNKSVARYMDIMHDIIQFFGRILKRNGFLCIFYNCRKSENWEFLRDPPGFDFIGRFDLNYSSGSIVQDNRNGALRSDMVLVYRPAMGYRQVNTLRDMPNWSCEFPY